MGKDYVFKLLYQKQSADTVLDKCMLKQKWGPFSSNVSPFFFPKGMKWDCSTVHNSLSLLVVKWHFSYHLFREQHPCLDVIIGKLMGGQNKQHGGYGSCVEHRHEFSLEFKLIRNMWSNCMLLYCMCLFCSISTKLCTTISERILAIWKGMSWSTDTITKC